MGKILKYWPKEEIIKALQSLPKDKPINKKSMIEYNKQGLICNSSGISKKFGSLKNACNEAGIRCDALYGKEHMQHMANLNIIYTKEKIKNILQDGYIKYGKTTPTKLVLQINKDNNCDIRGAIKKFYGTIENAILDTNIDYQNYHWTKKRIIETLRELNIKYGPLYKVQISDFRKNKKICGSKLIRQHFGTIENASRMAGFEFVEPQNVGHLFNGKIGKTETEILNNLEVQYGIKIIQQYRLEIDNKVYFLDGYDKINNVVYEIDERYHKYDKQKLLDNIKDTKIIKHLNCQIIRIKNY